MINKIAVVLPIYYGNQLKEFRLAVRSLLRQSMQVDIIIGCDGPINPMIEIYLKKLLVLNTNIYILRLNSNLGLANILNFCITKCISLGYEFIGRMDGDDFSIKNRFAIQYEFLISNPNIQAVGCQLITFSDTSRIRGFRTYDDVNYKLFNNFIYDSPLPHPGTLFRSTFFPDISYSDKYYLNEDYHLWLQAFKKKKLLANVTSALLFFRVDNELYLIRVGYKIALSGIRIQLSYIFFFRKFNYRYFLYTILIFIIKILPNPLIKFILLIRFFYNSHYK